MAAIFVYQTRNRQMIFVTPRIVGLGGPAENARQCWRLRVSVENPDPKSAVVQKKIEAGAVRATGDGAVEGGGVFRSVTSLARDASAATALEYGLVVGLVALALIAGMGFAGNVMENIYSFIATTLQNILAGS